MLTPLLLTSLVFAVLHTSTCSVTLASSFTPSSGMTSRRGTLPGRTSFILQTKGGSDEEAANIQQEQSYSSADAESQPPVPNPPPSASQQTSSTLGPKATSPGWLRQKLPTLPYHKFPDYLTYMRCIAIPCLCLLFYAPGQHVATGTTFAVASFTDWLDGFLARRWDISTPFGAFLDPVADKLMVSTALILLSGRYGAVVALPSCIILARELAVSALREWMAQKGLRDAVKVGYQGKVKTALTMISLTLLLLVPENGEGGLLVQLLLPGLVSLYVCSLITVTSGSVYFRAAAPIFFQN